MYKSLFSIAFVALALISVLLGFLVGKRKKWQFSVSKMIFIVVAAVAAMVLADLVSWLLSGVLYSVTKNLFENISTDLAAVGSAKEALRADRKSVV